jgi:hypothetical protein
MDGFSGRRSEDNGGQKFEAKVPALRPVEGTSMGGQGSWPTVVPVEDEEDT